MNPCKSIKVLIVEDSLVAREFLIHLLNRDPALTVAGVVQSGEEAVEFVGKNPTDVILMDIHLPGMDGFQTTRRIMCSHPTPIVVCTSGLGANEVAYNFEALECGAVALVDKPVGIGHPEFESMAQRLVETIRLMSEVKVVRQWDRSRSDSSTPMDVEVFKGSAADARGKVVAMGASTGGPAALQRIFKRLSGGFNAPILAVQHIVSGFSAGLVEWLNASTALSVQIAEDGQRPRPGHVYIAPDRLQMGLDNQGRIQLSDRPTERKHCPSVGFLFHSVAQFCGKDSIGVLLTGMGCDGSAELNCIKQMGGSTIVQDAQSSLVHGMPGEAIKLGAAQYVLDIDEIAGALVHLVSGKEITSRSVRNKP